MACLINLTTINDARGNLTLIEKVIPFDIKRIFYIYGLDDSVRGKHRHHKTSQAIVCIQGHCTVFSFDGIKEEIFVLDHPGKCLILEPKDWHKMYGFSTDAILMVMASEHYDPEDYIFEPYK
jgi:dTDP-4-dehydrorhamnose 3,5-epimerase-like enzyme